MPIIYPLIFCISWSQTQDTTKQVAIAKRTVLLARAAAKRRTTTIKRMPGMNTLACFDFGNITIPTAGSGNNYNTSGNNPNIDVNSYLASPFFLGNYVSRASPQNMSINNNNINMNNNNNASGEEGDKQNFNEVKLPFPWKLHQLLDDLEQQGRQDIASWLPDGKSFRIHKPEIFSKQIMSNYFRQTKFTSFIRQLYIYGFAKIEAGPGVGGYHHPCFLREDKSLTLTLGRNQQCDDRRYKHHKKRRITAVAAPAGDNDEKDDEKNPVTTVSSSSQLFMSTPSSSKMSKKKNNKNSRQQQQPEGDFDDHHHRVTSSSSSSASGDDSSTSSSSSSLLQQQQQQQQQQRKEQLATSTTTATNVVSMGEIPLSVHSLDGGDITNVTPSNVYQHNDVVDDKRNGGDNKSHNPVSSSSLSVPPFLPTQMPFHNKEESDFVISLEGAAVRKMGPTFATTSSSSSGIIGMDLSWLALDKLMDSRSPTIDQRLEDAHALLGGWGEIDLEPRSIEEMTFDL